MARARPTIRRRRVARELRRLREEAGRSREDIANLLECQTPKISKIETGRAGINPSELKIVLKYLGVGEPLYSQLVGWNRESRQRGLMQEHPEAAPEFRRPYIAFEQDASALQVFENELVHGLLQTEDYARTVIVEMDPDMPDGEVERRVALRIDRQGILTGEDPTTYWVILTEAVLRTAVGGPKVMADQLLKLIAMARLKNVTLQVLPFAAGAHAAMGSPFTILGFDDEDDLDLVYVEDIATSSLLEKPDQLITYSVAFNRLRASALSPEGSLALLQRVANEWTSTTTEVRDDPYPS